ncbi:thermonuclease family protein [Rhodoferax sp.]|uniref:thermonuclease family protein n=1 Tax=Rhodoferax sp. TaxID=50421 RepID=UPI0039B921BE
MALAVSAAQAQPFPSVTAPAGSLVISPRAPKPVHSATGFVTGVSDGDTFYLVIDGQSTRVRLAQIDAPEKAQPFGRRAEQALRELVWKRQVSVTWRQLDRYERPIVQVQVDGLDVNAELVRLGWAWVYTQYATDRSLNALEQEARRERRGLWADAHPIEPWEWRKEHK